MDATPVLKFHLYGDEAKTLQAMTGQGSVYGNLWPEQTDGKQLIKLKVEYRYVEGRLVADVEIDKS